jgi:hypothetical protein
MSIKEIAVYEVHGFGAVRVFENGDEESPDKKYYALAAGGERYYGSTSDEAANSAEKGLLTKVKDDIGNLKSRLGVMERIVNMSEAGNWFIRHAEEVKTSEEKE